MIKEIEEDYSNDYVKIKTVRDIEEAQAYFIAADGKAAQTGEEEKYEIRREAATAWPQTITAPQGRTFEKPSKGGGKGDPGRPKAGGRYTDCHT